MRSAMSNTTPMSCSTTTNVLSALKVRIRLTACFVSLRLMPAESWYLVKTTPGITGFIGPGRRPTSISEEEVAAIIDRTEDTETKPTPKTVFELTAVFGLAALFGKTPTT